MKILFVQTNYPAFLDSFHKKIKNIESFSYKELKQLWANEYFGSSDFYLKNLKPLGWEGDEIILNDDIIQSKWLTEHGYPIKQFHFPGENFIPARIRNLMGLNTFQKNTFMKQVKFLKPDVVYLHDVTFFNDIDLSMIKKHTKLIVGQIAYPPPLNESVLKKYDLIISSLPNFVSKFKQMGIKSEYLKWCAESELIKKIKSKKRTYDVTYVGGFSPHHKSGTEVLEKAARKINIEFWGYGEEFIPVFSPIRKTYHGQAWGRDMYEIFAKSKITINRHIGISGKYANNMRMFDATLMGALLITDHKSNISEFFNVGKEIITYNNSNELVERVKYYLSHPLEREKIAKAGQLRTLKDHSYKIRMAELSKILRIYLSNF